VLVLVAHGVVHRKAHFRSGSKPFAAHTLIVVIYPAGIAVG
jgi:hypothetical protein